MSTHQWRCRTCDRECDYDRYAPFGQGQEETYAVVWNCPGGHGSSLDVCPVGPLLPARELCLNCGAAYPPAIADVRCGGCGLALRACHAALGLGNTPAHDPIASARDDFSRGLFRRGLAILNQALQERPELLEPWFWKSRFLNSLGFNRLAAEMIGGALARFIHTGSRISLLEEQSFLWAECERGDEALKSADAALELGSDSVRAHYLRGRALCLVGQLEDGRLEIMRVLALDPTNADARRALDMIDAAPRPTEQKRW
jgi:hypothetical protein